VQILRQCQVGLLVNCTSLSLSEKVYLTVIWMKGSVPSGIETCFLHIHITLEHEFETRALRISVKRNSVVSDTLTQMEIGLSLTEASRWSSHFMLQV
jgi:hypothetical protein